MDKHKADMEDIERGHHVSLGAGQHMTRSELISACSGSSMLASSSLLSNVRRRLLPLSKRHKVCISGGQNAWKFGTVQFA